MSIADSRGDVAWTAERPPRHTDIVRAVVSRSSTGFELRVRFVADLPERHDGNGRTMNVASFYDVTGDGRIDYEVWANLADDGWGPSYRDRRERSAKFMSDSEVDVDVESNELVLGFHGGHLDDAESFRWAVASEWGSYHVLGTPAAARDSAPDNGAAEFPG